jgi:hypothetical protein
LTALKAPPCLSPYYLPACYTVHRDRARLIVYLRPLNTTDHTARDEKSLK